MAPKFSYTREILRLVLLYPSLKAVNDLICLELLESDYKVGNFIDRCEFPNIMAVHFVIHGTLGAGVSSTSSIDALGKVRHSTLLHFANLLT
jgi:hypothetical protein